MGFEPIPVSVEERNVESSAWEQGYSGARDHFERGRITFGQSTLIILAIGLAILAFPAKIASAGAGGLAAAALLLQIEITEIFDRHGLESNINLQK